MDARIKSGHDAAEDFSPQHLREAWDEGSAERQAAASGSSRAASRRSARGDMFEPLPLAYRLFRGPPIVTGRDGPGLSNPGGGQTSP
jgi:hypothetical protein